MSSVPDPVREGLLRGWKVLGGGHRPLPARIVCDVAIIGSGAGAGMAAELLTAAGLDVLILEEGPLRSSRDFRQIESEAYPTLYQESASRKTADKAITILQGRCVGGSTTVNWTSSFRTPAATLAHWREHHGLTEFTPETLAPGFEAAERRLGIAPWPVPPNANNDKLRVGAAKLGIATEVMRRNVRGCWNLGSCGLGCPTNAKQSMLVSTIPVALDRGATLAVQTRVERVHIDGERVTGLLAVPVNLDASRVAGAALEVQARHVVVAGGAINSPGLLMRSGAPDPHGQLGRRTFLHPVVMTTAIFDEPIAGWQGAPQSVYSDHFLHQHPVDGPIGFKLEAPPLHPVISSLALVGIGTEQSESLKRFPHTQALLALLRDGFHPEAPGGTVKLRADGSPELHYPLTPFLMDGARRAMLAMAEIQFAAGARSVTPLHEQARAATSWSEARRMIEALPMRPYQTRVVSAHVMGGCALSASPEAGVVRADGRHWQLPNLSIFDGSLFPTSIGANPQLSIYGLVTKLATQLALELTGRSVALQA